MASVTIASERSGAKTLKAPPRRLAPGHRKMMPLSAGEIGAGPTSIGRAGDIVVRRSLDFYEAVARRLAAEGSRP
jgi:hypothetical protein